MRARIASFLLATSLSTIAAAQSGPSYRCTSGDLVRRVEVAHPTGTPLPCEVHYYKDTEMPGQREVPWNAQNQAGYCESRAEELVANLRGGGWSCTAAAAEVRDDTDALSAPETP